MKKAVPRLLLILIALACGLAASEEAFARLFSSADLHRPLAPRPIPEEGDYARVFPAPSADVRSVLDARKKVKGALFGHWSVTKVDDRLVYQPIQKLVRAHALNPDDPYGSCLLGGFFALHHKFEAAIEATEESLRDAERIRERHPEAVARRFLGDLPERCAINLARYRLLLGEPETAMAILGEVEQVDEIESPLVRKAFWWLATQVLVDLGDARNARHALDAAGRVEMHPKNSPVSASEEYHYPQYFEHTAEVEDYLAGRILWLEGREDEAIARMEAAIEAWDRFYEARHSMAVLRWEVGGHEQAIGELSALLEAPVESKIIHPEVIQYNLARVYAELERQGDAEVRYGEAIRSVERRECQYLSKVSERLSRLTRACDWKAICGSDGSLCETEACEAGGVSGVARVRATQEVNPWLCGSLGPRRFSAAENNLGDLYLQSGRVEDAIALLSDGRKAAESSSELWHRLNLNLARAELEGGRYGPFLRTIRNGLGEEDAPVEALLGLLARGIPDLPVEVPPELEDLSALEQILSEEEQSDIRRFIAGAPSAEKMEEWLSEVIAARAPTHPVAIRLFLDVVEDIWGLRPPAAIQDSLAELLPEIEVAADRGEGETALLALRADRLLGREDGCGEVLAGDAPAVEELREVLLCDERIDGDRAIEAVERDCPDLLTGECEGYGLLARRDAQYLIGRWLLAEGEVDGARRYLIAARDQEPDWPLSRRLLRQLD